ncbi:TPA: hypothetical protein DDZ86_00815 [Candidatus Dependentiae bacterium]|nr:MAG: hypothetical protein UW09_C0004G0045 [candidate division TM6 bacterium GW2011_GWF2_43_87]HBL98166.1 hypothetical protein [Candidatus Dependentiae bacterium]
MNFLVRLKHFLDELDRKRFYQYMGGVILFVALLLTGVVFFERYRIGNLKDEIKKTNKLRDEARELLRRNAIVNLHKTEVDEILTQDKLFRIKEFFSQVVAEVGLTGNSSKEAELSSPQDLNNGYSEIRLDASFTGISTQQLSNLLVQLGKNRRIYIKELVATKSQQKATIDVSLIVATLQPKVST